MALTLRVIEVEGPLPVEHEGARLPTACTLADWVNRLGGYVGELPDPRNPARTYRVSLEEWQGRDPDTTWLQVYGEGEDQEP